MLESVATLWVTSATVSIKEDKGVSSRGMTPEVVLWPTHTHTHICMHISTHTCTYTHIHINKNSNNETHQKDQMILRRKGRCERGGQNQTLVAVSIFVSWFPAAWHVDN